MCRCSCPRSIRGDVIDFRAKTVDVKPAPPACWICGGDPNAIERAVKIGMQMAAFDTYADNLAATAQREQAERERQAVNRWHE